MKWIKVFTAEDKAQAVMLESQLKDIGIRSKVVMNTKKAPMGGEFPPGATMDFHVPWLVYVGEEDVKNATKIVREQKKYNRLETKKEREEEEEYDTSSKKTKRIMKIITVLLLIILLIILFLNYDFPLYMIFN